MGNVVQVVEQLEGVVEASPGAPVPLPALELPRARRPVWPTLAALAIVCGLGAVALGTWALVAETQTTPTTGSPSRPDLERAVAVVADSAAERFPLRGSVGRITLVVGERGAAVLALDGLGRSPEGSEYRAWVVPPGSAVPSPAGSFDGSERLVALDRRVSPGARVAVTLEPEGGADRPSRPLRLVAVRSAS